MNFICASSFTVFDDFAEKPPCIFADTGWLIVGKEAMAIELYKNPVRSAFYRYVRVRPPAKSEHIQRLISHKRAIVDPEAASEPAPVDMESYRRRRQQGVA